MTEVDYTTFATATCFDWDVMTPVYVGNITVANNELVLQLSTPYHYSGRNLMIGFQVTSWATTYIRTDWYGVNQAENSYPAIYQNANADHTFVNSPVRVNFIPKTTFTYESCSKPLALAAQVTPGYGTVASLTWTPGGTETEWAVQYSTSPTFEQDNVVINGVTANPCYLSGLTPETTYYARVKAVCGNQAESVFSDAVSFTPSNVLSVTLNDGTATNPKVPVYGMYVDHITKSQFIIPAADLAAVRWGTIRKLTFYSDSATIPWANAKFEVYMAPAYGTTLSELADFASMTKVMNEAHLEISEHKMDVTLSTPYEYLGGNLMIGFLQTVSGGWKSAPFVGVEAPGASFYAYKLNTNTTETHVQQNFLPKITFHYEQGQVPECAIPLELAVNYTGGTTAQVSWTSDATAWNLRVNGTQIDAVASNPYTLSGLELGTTYSVEVQAACDAVTSDWTGPVSFMTDPCMPENICELTFELTDSDGDGWNGAAICVTDVLTGKLLGELTNEDLDGMASGASELNIKTLAVCDGREIRFAWKSGYHDSEASYVVKDCNGEVFFSGSGPISTPINYTVNRAVTNCKTPTNLAVSEIEGHSAKLSWIENGEATAWKLAYRPTTATDFTEVDAATNPFVLNNLNPETTYVVKVRSVCDDAVIKWSIEFNFTTGLACPAPTDLTVVPNATTATLSWNGTSQSYQVEWSEPASYTPSSQSEWLFYDNGIQIANVGTRTPSTWHFGVMFPASRLTGFTYLNKVTFMETSYYTSGTSLTISIYQGGDAAPDSLVSTEEVICTASGAMREVMLMKTPVVLDPTKNLWIILTTTTISYPMPMCSKNEANGRWIYDYTSGRWRDIGTLTSNFADKSFMIRAFLDTVAPVYNWTTVSDVQSPYTLTGLTDETNYVARVKGNCGVDGQSNWTWATFTTTNDSNGTTSLDDLKATDGGLKFIRNGHIYILRDNIIYDATGRKMRTLD